MRRKRCGILVLVLLIVSSFAYTSADEFTTKNYYEPENLLIQQIAKQLKKGTNLETAEAIWNWMNENIEYGMSSEFDIECSIKERKGICEQQARISASIFIASGWHENEVRIGMGVDPSDDDHAWCEICTERWHRFDTVYSHSFEYEYNLPIYEEGKDYMRIDYYYYDPRDPPEIILKDSSTDISNNIHVITLELENKGGMRKHLNIEVQTNLEIIGSSTNFELLIGAGEAKETKIYLKGEGHVSITIGDIKFETDLYYNQESKKESKNSTESQAEETVIPPLMITEPSTINDEAPASQVEVKKITFSKETKIRTVKETAESTSPVWLLLFCIPFVFVLIFLKKH